MRSFSRYPLDFAHARSILITAFIVFLFPFIFVTHIHAMNSLKLDIHVLDIGQGDAMILHQPGICSILIDAGPLITGHRVTEKIKALDIASLDMVIVTHPHLDHFGGLFDLLPRIPTKRFYDNGMANDSWEYFDDYIKLRDEQPYRVLSRNNKLSCGDMSLEILYPPPNPVLDAGLNNTSMAILISFDGFRLLHMGDLAGEGEKQFLEAGPPVDITSDIIKIAHHGAMDSTSEQLLKMASPRQALISTAAENRIGSPADELLRRIAGHGIDSYRTDQTGDIVIRVQQGEYRIETEKQM